MEVLVPRRLQVRRADAGLWRALGPGILDVTAWRQKDSTTVHLVNLNNPMMMKGPLREIVPAPAQRVRLRFPVEVPVKAIHLLVAGTPVKFSRSGMYTSFEVPSIGVHEVIAIDHR